MKSRINICRPGHNASCALCCGSHNYDAEKDDINELFTRRRSIFKNYSRHYLIKKIVSSRSNLTGSYYFLNWENPDLLITLPLLYNDGLQCPFVAVLGDSGIIGCLLYPSSHKNDLRYDCFQNYTCKYFSCRAIDVLSDYEIEYAARLTGDWYYYSLLINRIDMLKSLVEVHPSPDSVPAEKLSDLKEELRKSLKKDAAAGSTSTYFS